MKRDFIQEMRRFLPVATVLTTLENSAYWAYLSQVLIDQAALAFRALK